MGQLGQAVNWIVLLMPVPIIALLVCHHAHKTGRSPKACLFWTLGSILLFPFVPIAYLVTRKGKVAGDVPGSDDSLNYRRE